MRSVRSAAAVLLSAAILVSTCACQSGSSAKDADTEEEFSEESSATDEAKDSASGGIADLINGIINGDDPVESSTSPGTDVSDVSPESYDPESVPDTSSQPAVTTVMTTATFDTDPAVTDVVQSAVPTLDDPDLEVNKRIKWMAWWDIDETTAAAELFKSVYGIPATGDDPGRVGRIFDYISVSYLERYDKLSTAIAAGDSPDLVPFEIRDFPNGAVSRYQPVDDIINLNSAKWAGTKDLMENFAVNGKHYCAFYELSFNSLMYYRKSVIEDAGLPDPRTLFENGEWTWDTFLDMARRFQTTGDNRYVVEGYNTDAELLLTTGTPIIGMENGRLVNNMNSPDVMRAMELLWTLQSENLRYPIHEYGWTINTKSWAQGDILFYADGGAWTFEESLEKYARKFGWSDDEICVVPYPRDPQADRYYHNMKQDAVMWCRNSENAAGVAAWIDCCVTSGLDPEIRAATIQQSKDRFGWTDYNLDFIYSLTAVDGSSILTPVFEYKHGIGTYIADASSSNSPVESLTKTVYLTGDRTYSQLKEEHFAVIDARINELNQMLSAL